MPPKEVALPDIANLDVVDAKQMVRSAIRSRRSKMTTAEAERYGDAFADTILDVVGDAPTVALYVSVHQEPATLPALVRLAEQGTRVLLPKLGPGLSRMWAWFTDTDDLREEAPGRPPSPSGEPLGPEAIEAAEAIIVPALAVDRFGHRVGQGGGWYDRMLKQKVDSARIGALIYPWELVSVELPHDGLDVPVPRALTPDGVIEL